MGSNYPHNKLLVHGQSSVIATLEICWFAPVSLIVLKIKWNFELNTPVVNVSILQAHPLLSDCQECNRKKISLENSLLAICRDLEWIGT